MSDSLESFKIKQLEHKIEAEKNLQAQELALSNNRYLKLNLEYQKLSSSQSFLFNENSQLKQELEKLQSKTQASSSDSAAKVSQLNSLVSLLKQQLLTKLSELECLQDEHGELQQSFHESSQQQDKANGQLKQQLINSFAEINQLKKDQQHAEIAKIATPSGPDSDSILKRNLIDATEESNKLKLELAKTKLQLDDLKVNQMLFKVIMEEKKNVNRAQQDTTNRINRAIEIEAQNLDLKQQLTYFYGCLNTDHAAILTHNQFKQQSAIMQANIDALKEQVETYKSQLVHYKAKLAASQAGNETSTAEIEQLSATIQDLQVTNKLLAFEVQKLRENEQVLGNLDPAAKDGRLGSLQELVDKYKHEISNRETKKRKLSDSGTAPEPKAAESVDTASLKAQIAFLQLQNQSLETSLKKAANIETQKAHLKILQLENNPMLSYQKIKSETLAALKQENLALLDKQHKSLVPVECLNRCSLEIEQQDKQVDELNKKLDRLRTVYGKKAGEFATMTGLLFGYNLEFLTGTKKIKLRSQYINNGPNDYLVIDPYNKTVQISDESSPDFRSKCQELTKHWAQNKQEIPTLLAQLTCLVKPN